MGAQDFSQTANGATAREAFRNAQDAARYEHGHCGYTGSIAEKDGYVVIRDTLDEVIARAEPREAARLTEAKGKPAIVVACAIANALVYMCDERVDDKWGPAGCIEVAPGEYLFFGIASS